MTDTIDTELPPLTDSMTAADLVTRVIALRQSIGPKAEIYLSMSAVIWAGDADRCVYMTIRPTGEYDSDAPHFTSQTATWPDAITQAETWARNWKITSRESPRRRRACLGLGRWNRHPAKRATRPQGSVHSQRRSLDQSLARCGGCSGVDAARHGDAGAGCASGECVMTDAPGLFDVIAVNIETGAKRFMAEAKSKANAEAIEYFAIARRGVDVEFYKVVPHGTEEATP
jgi:hypothetical protein